jgi:regulatory protein
MKITRIAKQERRERYNIFVDERFYTALSAVLLLESGVAEGDELEPGQLDPFIERDEAGKVLNQALRYLSLRPHSERELRIKLKRKDIDPNLIDDAFERLRELNYLDDAAFARQWIEERGQKRGAIKLRAELKQKGVADEVIASALESESTGRDELSDAQALAAKRLARFSGESSEAVREKLIRYLAGRGYRYETAREAVESLQSTRN